MFRKNLKKVLFLGVLAVAAFSSCKKEELLAPEEPVKDPSQTLIYIRAVDKDSSVVESQQILLR